ncbi:MAG: signal recognition particle protein [Holosporaceae bacterium]|nr:signal recognition particle protein [Holosporaceae bacterium]
MFDLFSEKISGIFNKLRRSGLLKESDVDIALREIRVALLEADVFLDVAKKFIADVRERAIGQEVTKSVSPGQMVVKIIHDYLVELFGKPEEVNLGKKPYKIMLVGLQGAGKTTTAGKLAKFFAKKGKKIAVASTDIYRPAAVEQLQILSRQVDGCLFAQELGVEQSCQEICKTALRKVADAGADVLIIDTAGRLHIDDVRMEELVEIRKTINPDEVTLVVDIMTGQDAINIAKKFHGSVQVDGIVLTRVDGDARGGVALSMRATTGCGIKFLCTGERLDDLEFFDPERISSRLLGMGDIVSLVEKAQETFSQQEAEGLLHKMREGAFSFDDFATQMEKMSKMGGLRSILKMLPQGKQMEKIMEEQGASDKALTKNLAIICSMTKKEKRNYKIINGSRRKRIAAGSGTTVQDVNKLIKQYEVALGMFKMLRKDNGGLAKIMSRMGRQ